MSLNHVTIMGRMTRDPEGSYSQSGTEIVRFTLAVDRDRKTADGSRETDFIDCVCFGKTAEFVSKYFGKGRMAVVDGRLQINDWTDDKGNKRKSASVVAQSVYFGDSKKDSGVDVSYGQEPEAWKDLDDEDCPF